MSGKIKAMKEIELCLTGQETRDIKKKKSVEEKEEGKTCVWLWVIYSP